MDWVELIGPRVVIFTLDPAPSPRGENQDSNAYERMGEWVAFTPAPFPEHPYEQQQVPDHY